MSHYYRHRGPIQSTSPPTANLPSPLPTNSQWCDDFNDGYIDENKWILTTDERDFIYVQNSALNLGFNAENSPTESSKEVRLEAQPTGQSIREISFTITLDSIEGKEPGGAGADIFLENGRDLQIKVGPNKEGRPEIEFYDCPIDKVPCESNYNKYHHPVRDLFQVGIRVPINIIWAEEKVEFHVNNKLRYPFTVDQIPITGLQFSAFADPGSIFHATVDDVCVIYVDG